MAHIYEMQRSVTVVAALQHGRCQGDRHPAQTDAERPFQSATAKTQILGHRPQIWNFRLVPQLVEHGVWGDGSSQI